MNEPTILPDRGYLEQIFLQEFRGNGAFYVGREAKLRDYELALSAVEDYFLARANRLDEPETVVLRFWDYLARH